MRMRAYLADHLSQRPIGAAGVRMSEKLTLTLLEHYDLTLTAEPSGQCRLVMKESA